MKVGQWPCEACVTVRSGGRRLRDDHNSEAPPANNPNDPSAECGEPPTAQQNSRCQNTKPTDEDSDAGFHDQESGLILSILWELSRLEGHGLFFDIQSKRSFDALPILHYDPTTRKVRKSFRKQKSRDVPGYETFFFRRGFFEPDRKPNYSAIIKPSRSWTSKRSEQS